MVSSLTPYPNPIWSKTTATGVGGVIGGACLLYSGHLIRGAITAIGGIGLIAKQCFNYADSPSFVLPEKRTDDSLEQLYEDMVQFGIGGDNHTTASKRYQKILSNIPKSWLSEKSEQLNQNINSILNGEKPTRNTLDYELRRLFEDIAQEGLVQTAKFKYRLGQLVGLCDSTYLSKFKFLEQLLDEPKSCGIFQIANVNYEIQQYGPFHDRDRYTDTYDDLPDILTLTDIEYFFAPRLQGTIDSIADCLKSPPDMVKVIHPTKTAPIVAAKPQQPKFNQVGSRRVMDAITDPTGMSARAISAISAPPTSAVVSYPTVPPRPPATNPSVSVGLLQTPSAPPAPTRNASGLPPLHPHSTSLQRRVRPATIDSKS